MRKFLSSTFVLFLALLSLYSCNQNDSVTSSVTGPEGNLGSAPSKVKMSTPTLTCNNSTQFSIDLVVTAGATGAPAGFSIQWMTIADYTANGWRTDTIGCHASFSGNANDSRYDLSPNESVTIRIGEILLDNGSSTNCPDDLICGTSYVFRVFAHANSSKQKSEFSSNDTCSTVACDACSGCDIAVKSQGYWKTHDVWPVNNLTLGTVNYTQAELTSILLKASGGQGGANGLISLAHQLIAVKLDIANGAVDSSAVASTVAAADALIAIGNLVVPPVGTGSLNPADTDALVAALDGWIHKCGNHCTE